MGTADQNLCQSLTQYCMPPDAPSGTQTTMSVGTSNVPLSVAFYLLFVPGTIAAIVFGILHLTHTMVVFTWPCGTGQCQEICQCGIAAPSDWTCYDESCYKRNGYETMTYSQARDWCAAQSSNTTMVQITDAVENARVQNVCGDYTCWLGLIEVGAGAATPSTSQIWRWADGTAA